MTATETDKNFKKREKGLVFQVKDESMAYSYSRVEDGKKQMDLRII